MQLGVTLTSPGDRRARRAGASRTSSSRRSRRCSPCILALLIITYLHVVIGELVPKGIALGYSERTALCVSAPVRGFFVVIQAADLAAQRSTEVVLRVLGLEPPGAERAPTRRPSCACSLDARPSSGEIEQEEQEMLYKVFDFADKEVADVMVPRPEVVALSIDLPPEEALEAVIDSPYTRYPVYRETLDQIVGDPARARPLRGDTSTAASRTWSTSRSILRPANIVPETKDLAALLAEFRRTNQHMAIVVDEYGDMEGIVTLEDLLEEIVGEIEDEFDLPDETVEQVDEDTIRIDGTFPIDDFNEQFEPELPEEDYHTVGGFVFGALGRAPEPGDEVEHDGMPSTCSRSRVADRGSRSRSWSRPSARARGRG